MADDPYSALLAGQPGLLRDAPISIDGLAKRDWVAYKGYIDASCDLTMRGGTTSGVVYPLAVCALAKRYFFRSVGGASAGAIAATVTSAAELGRTAQPVGRPTPLSVRPGFAGLEEVTAWLAGSDRDDREDWRLAQLFQPAPATRRLFRVLAASMQSTGPRGTGNGKLRCLAVALPAMLGPFSLFAVAVTLAVWLSGPVLMGLLPPSRWGGWPVWIQWATVALAVASVIGLGSSIIHGTGTARRAVADAQRPGATPVRKSRVPTVVGSVSVATPLLAGIVVFIARSAALGGALFPGLAWWTAASALFVVWLVLSLAAAGVLTVVLGLGASRFLTRHAEQVNFGLVPGTTVPRPGLLTRLVDRAAGMPKPTGVPGLSEWLADRIDDLAGVPHPKNSGDRYALTFGDLWRGRLVDRGEHPTPRGDGSVEASGGDHPHASGEDDLRARSEDLRRRVINLELMTTNLSQGRPYRMPMVDVDQTKLFGGTRWMFCSACLEQVLPGRVVRQLVAAAPAAGNLGTCERHPGAALHRLPEPWHIPVILATRMSLALPGLIAAVPLHSMAPPDAGRTGPVLQWFSDGGITSNFPIHFFDALLPRWPTFGLNLQQYPPGPKQEDVFIPPQDTTTSTEAWAPIGSAYRFVGSILDTFLGWRDTMQSALPGFRGRIAHVRQRPWEGGSNLFMRRDTIKGLAERGQEAGMRLRDEFTGRDGEVDGDQTQTDRYRWIRMRLAMRKYAELTHEIDDGSVLYHRLATSYEVPAELGAWFADPKLTFPRPDPGGAAVASAVEALAKLAQAGQPLAERIAGTPPVNPDLRLTPRE